MNVAVSNRPVRKHLFVPRATALENEFVHEQMIADKQSRLHRLRGNLEGLDDECGSEEREHNRHEQRFKEIGNAAPRQVA